MADSVKWLDTAFGVYEPSTDWNAVSGLYVFAARQGSELAGYRWRALYVGQTRSLASRLPTHEKWSEAVQLGATHIHVRVEELVDKRVRLERALIEAYRPPLNEALT